MIKGLYSAAGGMLAVIQQQDAITNNLANANTPGYKRESVSFSSFGSQLDRVNKQYANSINNNAVQCLYPVASTQTDVSAGVTQETSNPTDLAIDGPGFFVVGSGKNYELTRTGSFRLDNTGQLVTQDGRPVIGQHGNINVSGSDWSIDGDGSVRVDGYVTDKLRIVDGSSNPQSIGRVVQGKIEGSNVSVVKEMASMITALRSYEANQRTIQAIDQSLDKVINQVGRAG